MLGLIFRRQTPAEPVAERVAVGAREIPLLVVRHRRARRYLLRLLPNGTARVTIPRGGSLGTAREFVQRNTPWLARQLQKLDSAPPKHSLWGLGTEILLRGQMTRLEAAEAGWTRLGDVRVPVTDASDDLRPVIQRYLWKLAAQELPGRLQELAATHGLSVRRVTVRNQRTRWGSCSRHGTISLNWRLIQTPDFVRDYICLHELAHLLEMNHSKRFWRHVERLCPAYRDAERWLKAHPGLLRG
jgi:predicted metal-dependent hydrolase